MLTQWKVVIAVAFCGALFALGWYSGSLSGRLTAATRAADMTQKRLDEVLDGQSEQNKRAEKLQRTLDRMPRPSNKIREVVRENLSGCVLDPAVVDSVREGIRAGNASRKVP